MSEHLKPYRDQAAAYENLIAHEDYQQRLRPAISAIRSIDQADWVEWGAGTGRLTELAAASARSIVALDVIPAMLRIAADKLRRVPGLKWQTAIADHRRAPLPDACADIAIAGWTIIYLSAGYVAEWQSAVRQAIAEMQRVLRPGGALIVIETNGTGYTQPQNLYPDYYGFLQNELGFQHTWLRTDYQFASAEAAADSLAFFFGDEFAGRIRLNGWAIVPECTGLWWKYV